MSTPSLLPQPQPVQQANTIQGPDWNKVKAGLMLPEFHDQDTISQRDLLKKRAGLDLSNMDDNEFNEWKKQAIEKFSKQDAASATPRFDSAVEFARPFVSDAVGMGTGAIVGPGTLGLGSIPAGIGAKAAVDMLMQKLESRPPTSLAQEAVGATPGSFGATAANTAEQLLTQGVLNKVVGTAGKVFRDVDIPAGLKTAATDFGKNLMSRSAFSRYAGVGLPMHYLMGAISPEAAHASDAVISGLKLTTAAAKAIAKNPEAAAAMDSIMKGAPLNKGGATTAKILADALNGSELVATTPDGDKTMTLKDGKLVPLR
jgi:hypothetical protein